MQEDPGENLSDYNEDDEETLEDCSKVDEEESEDGFFVPDGYLSEDEVNSSGFLTVTIPNTLKTYQETTAENTLVPFMFIFYNFRICFLSGCASGQNGLRQGNQACGFTFTT